MSTAAVAATISVSTEEELMSMSWARELMVGVLFLGKRKERIYVSLGSQPQTV
jgi:23S rRNA maturation mini-RNase III